VNYYAFLAAVLATGAIHKANDLGFVIESKVMALGL